MAQQNWMTIQQLADRWGVGYETIRRQVASERIPSLKIGGVRRISVRYIEKLDRDAEKPQTNISEIVRAVRNVKRSLSSFAQTKDYFPDL